MVKSNVSMYLASFKTNAIVIPFYSVYILHPNTLTYLESNLSFLCLWSHRLGHKCFLIFQLYIHFVHFQLCSYSKIHL